MKATMNLPENTKRFKISVEGEMTGKHWDGEFETVCMPTLRQKANAKVMEAQLNQDLMNIDDSTRLYHSMVAQLATRLTAAPSWWLDSDNGQNLQDLNVIFEVFSKCAEAEREWREKVWGKPEDEVRDTTAETDNESTE